MIKIFSFDDVIEYNKNIGNKANNLYILHKNKIRVPKTWIIPSEICMNIMRDQGLQKVEQIAIGDFSLAKRTINQIGDALYKELFNEISKIVYLNPHIKAFAIRSSGIGEDGNEESFAGQYKSYLNEFSIAGITNKVIRCWEHGFSKDIAQYLKLIKKDSIAPCNILLQEMIPSTKGGVLIKSGEKFYLSANWGMVKSVVDGNVNVDKFEIVNNKIVGVGAQRKNFAYIFPGKRSNPQISKECMARELPKGPMLKVEETNNSQNYLLVSLNEDLSTRACVNEEEIKKVIFLGMKCADILGLNEYDMEWCFSKDELVLLQIRPLTCKISESKENLDGIMGLVGGTAYGKLFFLEKEKDTKNFEDGGILCTKKLKGASLNVIHRASGCIVESGSFLSHSALIAREVGIPTIGIDNINRISFGRYAYIDGRNSLLTYLDEGDCSEKKEERYIDFEDSNYEIVQECDRKLFGKEFYKLLSARDISEVYKCLF